MFQPIRTDPPPDQVRRITFVPFLADGRCVLIDEPGDPALPSGEVLDGEHYLLDTVLRVPLQTAGFRYQRFRPFGLDGDHLYGWIEGAPYTGWRPHADVELTADSAEDATLEYDADGTKVRYRRKAEPHAVSSPFAGMRDHAKYLVLEDVVEHLRSHGFADTKVVSNRLERNGRRVTVWAFR